MDAMRNKLADLLDTNETAWASAWADTDEAPKPDASPQFRQKAGCWEVA